jgi:DNA-binding CsgD family transcriptional regulator
MGHFLVFAFLTIVLCGTWATLSAWQQYRARGIVLFRSMFLYLISFNLLVLGSFVARYAETNLIGEDPLAYTPAIWVISAVGVFALELGFAWAVLRLGWDLRRKPLSGIILWAFVISATLIGFSYAIGCAKVIRNGSSWWIVGTHQAMTVFMLLAVTYTLIWLVAAPHTKLSHGQRRSARRFGWLLIVGVVVLVASTMLPNPVYLLGFAIGLLWAGCVPLIWLRLYSGPYQRTVVPEGVSAAMAMLARKHDLTVREQEIMALIVEGKSNKEIEDLLCISFSTVKNHVYRLYRKLGVNSRAQLMHLTMTEETRTTPSGYPQ